MLVSKLHTPTLRALAFARATRPHDADRAHRRSTSTGGDRRARCGEWAERDMPVPLTVLDSPYRDVTGPVLDYVGQSAATARATWCRVFIPEYVVGHWWEQLLHNQSALRLKATAAVPARRHGHQRAVAARVRRDARGPATPAARGARRPQARTVRPRRRGQLSAWRDAMRRRRRPGAGHGSPRSAGGLSRAAAPGWV